MDDIQADLLPALLTSSKPKKQCSFALNLAAVPNVESSQSARSLAKQTPQLKRAPDTARELKPVEKESPIEDKPLLSQGLLGLEPPYTPAQVLRGASLELTDFEKGEILSFTGGIYYFSLKKHKLRKRTSINHGFDDDRGDYKVIVHDHFAYRYEILGPLGSGSFGQVVKCLDHKTKSLVAVKIIRNKARFHQQAMVEVEVLTKLRQNDVENNANVIHLKEHFTFRSHLCITFELMSINLYEYVKHNNFQGVSLNLIRRFAVQLLRSLRYMGKHNVIHCDLKPENILLQHMNKSGLRVIDFGSSCYVNKRVFTYIQSRFYRSPEVILGLPYGMPIDMWSFGCILAELYTGYPLFPGENEIDQLVCIMEVLGKPPAEILAASTRRKMFFTSQGEPRIIANSRGRKRKPLSKNLSTALSCHDEPFLDFLGRCLTWDPAERIKPREGLTHPWIVAAKESIPRARLLRKKTKTSEISPAENLKRKSIVEKATERATIQSNGKSNLVRRPSEVPSSQTQRPKHRGRVVKLSEPRISLPRIAIRQSSTKNTKSSIVRRRPQQLRPLLRNDN